MVIISSPKYQPGVLILSHPHGGILSHTHQQLQENIATLALSYIQLRKRQTALADNKAYSPMIYDVRGLSSRLCTFVTIDYTRTIQ